MSTIAVVCGGYSDERVISLQSAETVEKALREAGFETHKIWIDRESWHLIQGDEKFLVDKNDFSVKTPKEHLRFDAVFNTIHGSPGENGLLQGYFDLIQMPYNNCDVFTSALTFHKAACNRYLKSFGIASAESVVLTTKDRVDVDEILKITGLPCFVKPNASGSSLGISKVKSANDLRPAIENAFREGDSIIIERFMQGTEVTCGAWSEDGKAKAIAITEIVSEQEFFDYQAKYHDARTQEITPARIETAVYDQIMRITEHIYKILSCRGVIRVDFIIESDGPRIIEVNTTPGLSSRSLIPQQLQYVGISLKDFFGKQISDLLTK